MHHGNIYIPGYKHAMVQIISASISTNQPILIENAPHVDDTFVLVDIINQSGGVCELNGNSLFWIHAT